MAVKVVKWGALPAALGLASFRVYAMTEKKTEDMISPRELSIYNPESLALQYVAEQPGHLQTGLGRVRVGLQPYVRTMQDACTSVKVGVTSLYQSGQDMYEFLRDPPPGFLPRVGVITVSGLAGLILARKGSRLKKIGFPLALTTIGAAVCYPSETVGVLKLTGKKVYSASTLVASAIKSKPKDDFPQTILEPVTPDLGTTTSKNLPKSELAEAIIREEAVAPFAQIAKRAPEHDEAAGQAIEDEPAAPIAEVTSLSDDVQQESTSVDEVAPVKENLVLEVDPIPDVALEVVTPVSEATPTEVIEISPVAGASPPDLISEEVATVSEVDAALELPLTLEASPEVAPVEDNLVLEVDPLPDVALEVVTPVSEATPTEVIEISPVAGASPPDLISEEVATVSEVDAALELPLTLEASPEVAPVEDNLVLEVDPLPDVALEVVTPVSEATPTEVIEISPVAGASPPDLISEEVATVSEVDAALELPLTLEASPEVAPVEDNLVLEVDPLPDVALEVVTPVSEATLTEVIEISPVAGASLPDLISEEVAPVSEVDDALELPVTSGASPEVAPVEDNLVLEVDPLPDVALEVVTLVSEATPTEVIEISPVAGASLPDLISEEVATVSEVDAALELPLTLEASPEVEDTLLPDVAPKEVSQTAAGIVVEVASVKVAPAVDLSSAALEAAAVDEASLVAKPVLEAAPKQDSKTEANHESTYAIKCAPDFTVSEPAAEVSNEAIDSDVSELPPTATEAAPVIPLSAEEPTTLSLSELHPEDENVQETTSSSPVVEITPTPLAEGQNTPPPLATEDTTSPLLVVDEAKSLPPAEEETTTSVAAEQIPALNPSSVKEKPRFVPDPSLVDHGQSHLEDADMYSTRG